ncbi:transposase [Pseudomonas fluorescens]|uniref:Uncharacterized protein n=1 Tax=Pseudomonas fluorescens TaxID=294 RepID=A0A5E7CTF9_PSEFL|nr:transposase [Pseudomonas fluorescens]VVO07996.1 hypothetical protein PS710_03212 [Pseudomonas fluorescens]
MNEAILARFDGCSDIDQIRERVTVSPAPVRALGSLNTMMGAEALADALKQIYLPNEFSLGFIKEMVDRASLYSRKLFESQTAYLSRIYNPPDVEVAPICLTGLAGIGKSQTIAALLKVLPPPIGFTCDHFEGTLQLVSYWYASARGKAGGRQLLADFVLDGQQKSSYNSAKLLIECRRRVNRDGVSMLILEETQHINKGQGASKVTDILLTMAAIGPPMIYVSNYSLVHKLLDRNSEDKQRLLSEPRVMWPEAPDGLEWRAYIAECVRVSAGHIQAPLDDLVNEIYRSTFGIKRLAVQLIKLAYIEARSSGRECIDITDITRAYRSPVYASSQIDVEELHMQILQNRTTGSRMDLRCPFEVPSVLRSNIVKFARADRDNRVINMVFHSSLNESERSAIEQIEPEASKATRLTKTPRRPRLPKASETDLANAFEQIVGSMDPAKPKKPR